MADAPTAGAPRAGQYVDSAPFWEGVRDGRLVLQACGDTGRLQHYPRPVSLATGSRNLTWRAVSGRGTVYAWTVLRVPTPGLPDNALVATIELEEGVRILGRLLDADPADVAIGKAVTVAWDRLEDGTPYPAFKLA